MKPNESVTITCILQLDILSTINYDDNGAYGDRKSVKKDYFVQEEDGKLIVNTAHKEANQYAQPILR